MTVHLLGTGSANAGPDRTTTMLAVEHGGRLVVVDCGGDVVQRMLACGLDPLALDALILTHEHPDHISGYPLMLEKLWLLGRREPIPVYGPAPTLDKAKALFAVFDTGKWHGMPGRSFHEVDLDEGAPVVSMGGLTVTACPVDHPVPTIGLRFETDDAVLAYSCDTAECEAVARFGEGADVLIHEATGSLPGVHASAEEAAGIAARAGARRLVLVHTPADLPRLDDARDRFADTEWGHDGDCIEVGMAEAVGHASA